MKERINFRTGSVIVVAMALVIMMISSCYYSRSSPGWEYMPDMVHSPAYETYSVNPFFPDSMNAAQPVTGSIPRGVYMPFHFSPNPTGYDSAGMYLHFPAWLNDKEVEEGKRLFRRRIDCTREALLRFAEELTKDDSVALEVTTNAWAVADLIQPFVARVVVSNPMKTKAIAEAKVKTDKVDAEVLAQLLRCDYLPSVWVPDQQTRSLRQLTSLLRRLPPDQDFAERPDQGQGAQVRFRLETRAEHRENLGIGARKRVRRGGSRASGPDLRNGFRVGDASDGAILSIISDHDALVPSPSRPVRIVEHADQLGAESRKRRKFAGHGPEHLVLADSEYLPQRLRPLAARQGDHRAPHRFDAARIIEQLFHLGRVIKGDCHGAVLLEVRASGDRSAE